MNSSITFFPLFLKQHYQSGWIYSKAVQHTQKGSSGGTCSGKIKTKNDFIQVFVYKNTLWVLFHLIVLNNEILQSHYFQDFQDYHCCPYHLMYYIIQCCWLYYVCKYILFLFSSQVNSAWSEPVRLHVGPSWRWWNIPQTDRDQHYCC